CACAARCVVLQAVAAEDEEAEGEEGFLDAPEDEFHENLIYRGLFRKRSVSLEDAASSAASDADAPAFQRMVTGRGWVEEVFAEVADEEDEDEGDEGEKEAEEELKWAVGGKAYKGEMYKRE
ncbi:Protein of unknown function, partial [Gryllus bimaculatus]